VSDIGFSSDSIDIALNQPIIPDTPTIDASPNPDFFSPSAGIDIGLNQQIIPDTPTIDASPNPDFLSLPVGMDIGLNQPIIPDMPKIEASPNPDFFSSPAGIDIGLSQPIISDTQAIAASPNPDFALSQIPMATGLSQAAVTAQQQSSNFADIQNPAKRIDASTSDEKFAEQLAGARESAEVAGTNVVSDIGSPLTNRSTPLNDDGGVDTAWWVGLGTDKGKLSVGIANFGSSGNKISSPAGSLNIFDPKGSSTTTVSNNVTEASQKAWDAFGDAEKMTKALKAIPGLGVVEGVIDGPSITKGTYNDGSPMPSGVSWGGAGVKVKTELGDGKLTFSLGNSSGAGESFAELETGAAPVGGVVTLQIDPTKGLAKALMSTPIAPVGAALDLSNRLGVQNTISYSVPVTLNDLDNPNFEGFRLPNGQTVKDPVAEITQTARDDVVRDPLMNYGNKDVARYNAELQFALGTNPLDVARVSVNPSTGMRNNYGSDTLSVANQFYDTLVSYGGAKEGERIPSSADFSARVDSTINKLHDAGRDKEIPTFLGKLANPYGVNAGNGYVAEANKSYSGSKRVDSGTAQEAQNAFNGKYQRSGAAR
jgi:hypothetical protein